MSTDDPNAASPANDAGLLDPHARAGPPSIISSRMTDIASEDGDEPESPKRTQRRSLATSESRSRPDTARTAASSRHHPQPLRKTHLSGLAQRRSGGSVASSVGRTPSASRSHVPSLTSNAFYRPMSSQKLQAQRGGTRLSQQQQPAKVDEAAGDGEEASGFHGLTTPRARQHVSDDGSCAPPSRGTEVTGPETIDRRTANTSPTTQGHHAQGSITDSVRPLQKRAEARDLTVGVDRGYMDHRGGSFSGIRTPRSFRSSFLMPRSDSGQNGSRRGGLEGVEKLSSGASTPHHASSRQGTPGSRAGTAGAERPAPSRVGRVFEYFEGNTVFCLGGRFQNARQRPVNVATGLFVVVPSVLFFVFSASDLWHEVSPAIPIVFAYLVYICFSSFIHASVSDPGVSPPIRISLPIERASLTNGRSSRGTSTSSHQPKTTTPCASAPRRRTGTSSSLPTSRPPPWRCPSSTAAPATSGGPRARTTAACATTASRRTTTTACGSTTASAAATTATSSPS